MGDQIYRHGLNKGGLEDILSNQRLLATEARGVAGGGGAVRAMNGPFHTPYKGEKTGIEFTTSVKGRPRKWNGDEGTEWDIPEGQYLQIRVTRVLYPGGKIDTFAPEPAVATPAVAPPKVGQVKRAVVTSGGRASTSEGAVRPTGGGGFRPTGGGGGIPRTSGGAGAGGRIAGVLGAPVMLALVLGEIALKQWLIDNVVGPKWEAEIQVLFANAIEASRFWFNHLITGRSRDIRQAKAKGENVTLHLVVDSQWIETFVECSAHYR